MTMIWTPPPSCSRLWGQAPGTRPAMTVKVRDPNYQRLALYAARTSRCCLRPADSLIASPRRSATATIPVLRRSPARRSPARRRRGSAAAPRRRSSPGRRANSRNAGMPASSSLPGHVDATASDPPPRLPRTRGVRCRPRASAAARPCARAVASVASTFFASLISAPAQRLQPGDLRPAAGR